MNQLVDKYNCDNIKMLRGADVKIHYSYSQIYHPVWGEKEATFVCAGYCQH